MQNWPEKVSMEPIPDFGENDGSSIFQPFVEAKNINFGMVPKWTCVKWYFFQHKNGIFLLTLIKIMLQIIIWLYS